MRKAEYGKEAMEIFLFLEGADSNEEMLNLCMLASKLPLLVDRAE